MTNTEILDELFDYMFAEIVSLKDEKNLRQFRRTIFRVLRNNSEIPEESYQLVSNKRYHLKFDIIEGFLWHFEKLNETLCSILKSDIQKISNKITINYIDESAMFKIIIHTLVVNFFEENIDLIFFIRPNPLVELLQGFFSDNPKEMGSKAN